MKLSAKVCRYVTTSVKAIAISASLCYFPHALAQSGEIRLQTTQHTQPKSHGPVAMAAQPIVSARVYWFAINTAGYGSAPISMIAPNASGAQVDSSGNYYVLSTSTGSFNITAWNACPTSNSSQYVLALGGAAGSGQDNPNIAMVTVIPVTCGNGWHIHLSEITTVAAAYGVGAFASIATNSFATDSNSSAALQAGVAYSNSLVSSNTGAVPSGSAWQTTIDTLADMLAVCSVDAAQCPSLFAATTPPGGTTPINELQAALNIALKTNLDLSVPFNSIPSSPGWTPYLGSYPTNWTMPGSSVHINGVTPQPAPVGSTVTIQGAGFGASQGTGTLVICGVQATVTNWTDNAITALVPASPITNGYVQVFQSPGASGSYPFVIAVPVINSLSPPSGVVGTLVTINGANFGTNQGASIVTFNGTTAVASIWSDSTIIVQVPDGATSGNVLITANNIVSNGVYFTVVSMPAGLSVASLTVSPGSASVVAGGAQQYSAAATYSDGSTQDVTSAVTWTSSDPSVAVIDSNGVASAVDDGAATIQASVGSITGTATLTVTPGPLNPIVTPVRQLNGFMDWPSQKTIGIGHDGFARFVVSDSSPNGSRDEVVYVRCLDEDCTTFHTATFTTGTNTEGYSMALGPDGYPRIAYTTYDPSLVPPDHHALLGFIQCADDDCASRTITPVDGASDNAVDSITVAPNGTSYILYDAGGSLRVPQAVGLATCSSASCSTTQIANIPAYDDIGGAITIGGDGNPAIIYEDSGSVTSGTQDSVHYYSNGSDVIISSNGSGYGQAQDIALGPDGFARLAYINQQGNVDFVQCTNSSCGAHNATAISFSGPYTQTVSLAVGSDGNAVLQGALSGNGQVWWDYLECATADCSKHSDGIAAGSWYGIVSPSVALSVDGVAHMIAIAGTGSQSPTVTHARVGQGCPTSITLSNTTTMLLDRYVPNLLSGIGIVTAMQANPSTNGKNWNGTKITENTQVILPTNTCPAVIPTCNGTDTFTVGCVTGKPDSCSAGFTAQMFGKSISQKDNTYYDVHVKASPTSWLNAPGVSQAQCAYSCSQVYYCKKKAVGNFTIDYQFKRDSVYGVPVTRTTVTKH